MRRGLGDVGGALDVDPAGELRLLRGQVDVADGAEVHHHVDPPAGAGQGVRIAEVPLEHREPVGIGAQVKAGHLHPGRLAEVAGDVAAEGSRCFR